KRRGCTTPASRRIRRSRRRTGDRTRLGRLRNRRLRSRSERCTRSWTGSFDETDETKDTKETKVTKEIAEKLQTFDDVVIAAPAVKRIATEGYGGEVVLYDRDREDREAIGKRLASERSLTLVPPYDHPHIIAGQGTAARELIVEIGTLDFLFVPCGGGGLLSGSALAANALAPRCQVIGVEPAAGDDATRS